MKSISNESTNWLLFKIDAGLGWAGVATSLSPVGLITTGGGSQAVIKTEIAVTISHLTSPQT